MVKAGCFVNENVGVAPSPLPHLCLLERDRESRLLKKTSPYDVYCVCV